MSQGKKLLHAVVKVVKVAKNKNNSPEFAFFFPFFHHFDFDVHSLPPSPSVLHTFLYQCSGLKHVWDLKYASVGVWVNVHTIE